MAVKQLSVLNLQHGREHWGPCLGSRQQPCDRRSVPTCESRHAATGLHAARAPCWRSLQYIRLRVTGRASQWHVPFQPAAPSHCMDVPGSPKHAHGPMPSLRPPALRAPTSELPALQIQWTGVLGKVSKAWQMPRAHCLCTHCLCLKKVLIFASTVFEDQSPAAIGYAKHYSFIRGEKIIYAVHYQS